MKTETTTVEYNGVELEVIFRVVGAYYASTRESPEEQPDFELHEVLAGGVDISPLLTYSEIDDIYELLMEKLF